LKLAASTATLYNAGSSVFAEYDPDFEVVNTIDVPVPTFVIVTVAPGTTDPLGSVTVPVILPLLVCPIIGKHRSSEKIKTFANRINSPPLVELLKKIAFQKISKPLNQSRFKKIEMGPK
jgi:hypothetical protein